MENNETYLRIEQILEEIYSEQIISLAQQAGDTRSWTRQRKMPLRDILLCIMAKKGLTSVMELRHYFNEIGKPGQAVSKQDYLRQRQKLNPEVFKHLNANYLRRFYGGQEAKTWQGYVVLAIDGSKVEIPNSTENRQVYGASENQHRRTSARANCSVLYDVLNGFMLDVGLHPYQGSEINEAKMHLGALEPILGGRPVLIIFDRNYVSLEFLDILEKKGIKYLMRLQSGAYKAEVAGMQGTDEQVELEHTKARLRTLRQEDPERRRELKKQGSSSVRMIRTVFKDEKQGILLTNLQEGSAGDIQRLYRKRWTIEQQYHTMKNKMKFESVTGKASIYVKQDFLAQALVFNIIQDLIIKAEYEAAKKPRKIPLRYQIRVNQNIAIGLFKEQFIKLMLEKDNDRKGAMFICLVAEMERHILPVRKLKTTERRWSKSNKYKCNQKPSF